MASSEVAFEEFKLQNTTAAIYVLDKTLYKLAEKIAEKIKKILIQGYEISVCGEVHWSEHIGDTIAKTSANFEECQLKSKTQLKLKIFEPQTSTDVSKPSTDVSIRDYGYLERLITEAKRRVEGQGLHHDVIILLGHSSVLLAEDKDVIEAFAKLNPTIIAFLGCCGGNTRYGPIVTMSYMLPSHCKPIIAFYQQQIYTEELENTSLIIGLQYYLHIHYSDKVDISQYGYTKKDMAKCAFALAKLNKSVPPTDPTVFINDRNGKNPVQMILHKCDLTTEAAPLSCMQLAMYSPMVVDSKEFRSFTIDDKWLIHDPPDKFKIVRRIIPTITLPKESCLEHKLVIDDVLWKLDQQKIKIMIHGHGDIKIEQLVDYKSYDHGEVMIKISETLPTKIAIMISEDNKNLDSKKIGKIDVMFPRDSIIVHSSTDEVTIKLAAGRGVITINKIETIKLQPQLYSHTYMCRTMISQDEQEIRLISQDLPKGHLQGITVDDLSRICWKKIEELHLHKIIPLVCEIKFIKLFNETLKLLRIGDKSSWERIDPLQFLVAVLRGHWGKNNLTCIKEWATFCLLKSMGNVKRGNPKLLHQYKLCCMCFVLLFNDSFVRFAKPDEKECDQYEIIVCNKEEHRLIDVICNSKSPQAPLHDPSGIFPTGELAGWVGLFECCDHEHGCIDLYKSGKPWEIRNHYRIRTIPDSQRYPYQRNELLLCLGALSDEARQLSDATDGVRHQQSINKTTRQRCYNVKEFFNQDNEKKGHMEYFSDLKILADLIEKNKLHDYGISYTETKLVLDSTKFQNVLELHSLYAQDLAMQRVVEISVLRKVIHDSKNWEKISSCRFVFAQFVTPITPVNRTITGILFYTDTHYGHNLIEFNEAQLDKLQTECPCKPKNVNCFNKLSRALQTPAEYRHISERELICAISKGLCRPCRYRMLDITIQEIEASSNKIFPFIKVGRLTLTYNDNGQLDDIHLDECA